MSKTQEQEPKRIPSAVKKPAGAKFQITVEDELPNGDVREYTCFLKAINRQTFGVAMAKAIPASGQPDYVGAGEIILFTAWLDGDEELKKDDSLLLSAAMQAYGLIEIKTSSLKKL